LRELIEDNQNLEKEFQSGLSFEAVVAFSVGLVVEHDLYSLAYVMSATVTCRCGPSGDKGEREMGTECEAHIGAC
jgi:hypothetical protein